MSVLMLYKSTQVPIWPFGGKLGSSNLHVCSAKSTVILISDPRIEGQGQKEKQLIIPNPSISYQSMCTILYVIMCSSGSPEQTRSRNVRKPGLHSHLKPLSLVLRATMFTHVPPSPHRCGLSAHSSLSVNISGEQYFYAIIKIIYNRFERQ